MEDSSISDRLFRNSRLDSTLLQKPLDWIALYWVPRSYDLLLPNEKIKHFKLSMLQRIFVTLEFPQSCTIADIWAKLSALVIVLSVVSIITSTYDTMSYFPTSCDNPACDNSDLCPNEIICPPVLYPVFGDIDLTCVVFFTVDFVTRMTLCGIMPARLSGTVTENWDEEELLAAVEQKREPEEDPSHPMWQIYLRYLFTFFTIVDLISIMPTYISLALKGPNAASGLSALRVLRLLRVLRVMRISVRGRMIVDLLSRTLKSSQEAFAILLFYLGLMVVFFASAIYAVESGTYTINDDYPGGAYLRPNGFGGESQTPFDSIPTTIYYMIVTFTTVGYGDLAPTTIPGRAIASFCCVLGILATALPISIISNNFSVEYQRYLERKAEFEQREKMKVEALKRRLPKQVGVLKRIRSIYVSDKSERSLTSDGESIKDTSQHDSVGIDKAALDSSSGHKVELVESNRTKSLKVINETRSPFFNQTDINSLEIDSPKYNDEEKNDRSMASLISYPDIMKLSTMQIHEMEISDVRSRLLELRDEYDNLFQKYIQVAAMSQDMQKLANMLSRATAIDMNSTNE